MAEETQIADMNADLDNLYREESFTDLKVAQIRRLTPIKPDGSPDDSRPELFIGETQLMSPRGPVPIHSPIEAKGLKEAFEKFPEAINAAVERLVEEAKEIQRQEASRIVVPGSGPTGGMLPGSVGPSGKITLR